MNWLQRTRLLRRVHHAARADGKAAYFRLHRHRYTAILAALDTAPRGSHVLEVGVTPGQCTRMLVGAGYRVSGVDLDPSARRSLWEELGVAVCRMNIERQPLPFASNTFDRVVFSEVIEHLVYSPLPVLREFWRVLKPGGQVIITSPNELYLKSRLRTIVRALSWKSLDTFDEFRHTMELEGDARYTTHTRTYTMHELRWLAERAGFCVVRSRAVSAWERVGLEPLRVFRHPVGVLAKGALTATTTVLVPTRSMLLLVAEKHAHNDSHLKRS